MDGWGQQKRSELSAEVLFKNTLFHSPHYFPHTYLAWLIFLLLNVLNLAHLSCLAIHGISEITATTLCTSSVENLRGWLNV
jgi:hypothetical protein